jgi:hypothetical protein
MRVFVQSSGDPEIYPGAVRMLDGTWKCGKYGNDAVAQGAVSEVAYWERHPITTVGIPGVSEWTDQSTVYAGNVAIHNDTLTCLTPLR